MRRVLLFIATVLSCMQGRAEWNTDFSKNMQVTPSDLSYYDRSLATNKNGMTYVYIICPSTTGQAMRLQVIDKDGNRTLGRGGQVISNERNKTWVTWNQYLELDNDGNAFVSVQDMRNSESSISYTIYKYSEKGDKLWEGTTLNDGIGSAMGTGLSMMSTTDGGLLCAYSYTDTEKSRDFIHVEKLDKDGKPVWKKEVFETERVANPYPFLVKTEGGNAMLLWVDKGNMDANIIDPETGELERDAPTVVYTNGYASEKVMEVIKVTPGPDNGALLSVVDGNKQGRLVYVKSDLIVGLDGKTTGVLVDTSGKTRFASTNPAVVYSKNDNTLACAYKIFDYDNTDNQAVYFQKIGMDGKMKWDGGKEYVGLQTDNQYSYFNLRNIDNDAFALFYLTYDNATYTVKGQMATFDNDGNTTGQATDFTTSASVKTELWVSEQQEDKRFLTAWDSKSSSGYTLYMQDIEAKTPAGITNPLIGTTLSAPLFYSVDGTRRSSVERGLNIVRNSDGKVIKIAK